MSMRVCLVLHTDLYEPWPVLRAKREVDVLRRLGREVVVVSWIKDETKQWPVHEVRDGVRIRRVKFAPPKSAVARALGYRRISRMFAEEVIATKPDAILCHDLEMLWSAAMAGRALQVPVLYHAHEDWPAMVSQRSPLEAIAFANLERRLVKEVDHVYTVGEDLAEKYRQWGKPVTVQYGSKSLAEMPRLPPEEREEIRRRFGLRATDIVVGIAGALGTGWALEPMLAAVKPMDPSVRLFVVGGFPDKIEAARELVEREAMGDRVAFTGPLPTPDYLRHTGVLDIGLAVFHAASANLVNVMPQKLFDYMGLGVPTVISDFPAMRRVAIDDCHFAIAVDPDSPESIRKGIAALANDPEQRRAMAESAIRRFRDTYCWERQEEALRASHPIFAGARTA